MMRVVKADEAFYSAEARLERWMTLPQPVRVFGSDWYPETEVLFGDVTDVQRYVDRVLAHIGCTRPIKVRERRGNAFAHYSHGEIAVPPRRIGGGWALREHVILHEVAHHLSAGHGHGPAFGRAFVDLLTDTGHVVTARMLEIALLEEGCPAAPKN